MLALRNIFKFQAYAFKGGPLLWEIERPNLIVTEGLNDLLTKYLKGAAYTATPFLGLINNADFGSLQASDTAAKITTGVPSGATNQWKELTTLYDETTRRALTLGTATNGSIDNLAAAATFTFNGAATVKGAFIISNSTKGGTTGVLYGEVAYSALPVMVSPQVLTVTVRLTASSL